MLELERHVQTGKERQTILHWPHVREFSVVGSIVAHWFAIVKAM
jgi:hypothetical protein